MTIRLGISSCLLGEPVRYDGVDKRDSYITTVFAEHFELVPVCPEVAIGMGVPREPIRLEGDIAHPRAVGVHDKSLESTRKLEKYGKKMVQELSDISGYIFKSRSPSCGLEGLPVYRPEGKSNRRGVGVYARQWKETRPLLPVIEETGLMDPGKRDNFLERVFAWQRWHQRMRAGITRTRLQEFHHMHRLTLMAHGRNQYLRLDELIAASRGQAAGRLARAYLEQFVDVLSKRANRRLHDAVLSFCLRSLVKSMETVDIKELQQTINAYRTGRLPLVVPVTLLRHHAMRTGHPGLLAETYLNPSTAELILRYDR